MNKKKILLKRNAVKCNYKYLDIKMKENLIFIGF